MRLLQHLDLLLREERSLALRAAIERVVVPGSTVLDAGCGTGLLSLWAARAGAHVVAVDTSDLSLARRLAVVNGVDGRINFLEADLHGVSLDRRFDTVLALLYFNDPRRDERQAGLAADVYARFLRPGGEPIPDSVRYAAQGFSWPEQAVETRWRGFDAACRRLEDSYGVILGPLGEALRREPDPSLFPRRRSDGRLEAAGAVPLTEPVPFATIDYRTRVDPFPERLTLLATTPGTLHVVVWTQELVHQGFVLFRNQSLSWVFPPPRVQPGDRCDLAVDGEWRSTNVLKPQRLNSPAL